MSNECPNCGQKIDGHEDNGCVLNALICVIRERENLSEKEIADLHANCDIDSFWERAGMLVDMLESGFFSRKEEA